MIDDVHGVHNTRVYMECLQADMSPKTERSSAYNDETQECMQSACRTNMGKLCQGSTLRKACVTQECTRIAYNASTCKQTEGKAPNVRDSKIGATLYCTEIRELAH